MHTRPLAARSLCALVAAIAVTACGGSSNDGASAPPATTTGYIITISGMRFTPLDLHVPPGGTVTVINQDSEVHSVTSETAPSAFTPGAVAGVSFDTGVFVGQRTFTIPAAAADKTVVPYYCTSHKQLMVTPTGTITVDTSAGPATPPSPTTPSPMPPGY
jgi:plastocyanin